MKCAACAWRYKMKLFAPEYYKDFVCIADKCKHSCCIGWEIDIDSDTMEKYEEYKGSYAKELKESIDKSAEPQFKLDENERCPHLNERGLCNLILNVGEDFLCHICREHPRFYNDTPHGREVGLGMACEEACRIILGSDKYMNILSVGECDGIIDDQLLDTPGYRKEIYAILSDRTIAYSKRLDLIAEKYGLGNMPDIKICLDLVNEFEYLDQEHKKLFESFSWNAQISPEAELCLERALAYYIYRHLAECYYKEEICQAVGLCLFWERLLASLISVGIEPQLAARIVSEEVEYSEDNTEAVKGIFGAERA